MTSADALQHLKNSPTYTSLFHLAETVQPRDQGPSYLARLERSYTAAPDFPHNIIALLENEGINVAQYLPPLYRTYICEISKEQGKPIGFKFIYVLVTEGYRKEHSLVCSTTFGEQIEASCRRKGITHNNFRRCTHMEPANTAISR